MASKREEKAQRKELKRILKLTDPEAQKKHAAEAFGFASDLNDDKAVRVLFHRGYKPDQGPTGCLSNCLQRAAYRGHLGVTRALLRGQVDPNEGDGFKPLHLATAGRHPMLVKLLLEYGADPMLGTTKCGMKPSTLAYNNGHMESYKLLRKAEFCWSPETYVEDERTIFDCIEDGDVGGVREHLDAGTNPNSRFRRGETTLHYATRTKRGSLELTELLLERGANPNIRDHRDSTVLDYLCMADCFDTVQEKRDKLTKINMILDRKVDRNSTNEKGESAIFVAVRHRQYDKAKLLLDRGVNVNMSNHEGITSLHIAGYYADIPMVELLLKYGADPLAKDKSLKTPSQVTGPSELAKRLREAELAPRPTEV